MILEEQAESAGDGTVMLHEETRQTAGNRTVLLEERGNTAKQQEKTALLYYSKNAEGGTTDDAWMWNAIQHLYNLGQRETCAGGIVDIRTGTDKIGERAVLM